MTAKLDLTGQTYGRLTVLREAGNRWECECSCGNLCTATTNMLRMGRKKSCGCLRRETTANSRKTHGETKTRTYRIWNGMKNRCTNPNNKRYSAYGGRGITLDPKWYNYEGFIEDMGHAPNGLSIDRVDNDGPYTKGNCRWATKTEQARNSAKAYTYEGRSTAEWAEELGLTVAAVAWRFRKYGSPHLPDTARKKLEVDGKPLKEWAKELGKPYSTVRMHYYMHGHLDRLK